MAQGRMMPWSRWPFTMAGLVAAMVLAIVGWDWFNPPARTLAARIAVMPAADAATEPILPIPQTFPVDQRKAALGRRVFHDRQLSRDRSISCATCHSLGTAGVDGKRHSIGIAGKTLAVNTPTVLNSGYNFRQFWDGRAATLDDQVDGPLQHEHEMGSTWAEVLRRLKDDASYRDAFDVIYADGVQVANVKDAIATFERTLITPNSRFDRFLRGDRTALTDGEAKGYRLFKNYGCVACHQGINVGGNLYQRFGVMADYFKDRGNPVDADLGRFNVTKLEEDKHVFKVPGLRNVALTAPYFHDGSAATLEQAVVIMGKYQLGVAIPAADVALLVSFLGTLTGDAPQ